jgi:hypothetical protein
VDERVAATYKWFNTVVIGQKLCPFAPPLKQNPELMRVVCSPENASRSQAIKLVQQEIQALYGSDAPQHETTLVILDLPGWSNDFREFIRLSWDLQDQLVEQTGLVGSLQRDLFLPMATHQTYGGFMEGEEDNPADYTIRSPYPTVHLLREVDVLKAVQGGYPQLETLPMRNQAKLVQQGLELCQQSLVDCYPNKEK